MSLQSVHVNLQQKPRTITEKNQEDFLYVLGDLHGNAFKGFRFPLELGLIDLPQQNFNRLVEIYNKKNDQLTTKDINDVKFIFQNLKRNKNGKICFIGDTVADRRWNDGIFLLLMHYFRKLGIDVEIPVSNHDIEFILRMEADDLKTPITLDDPELFLSLSNLNKTIDSDLFTKKEISELYSNDFVPSLKAISYALDGNNIMILSHAAIGINVIKSLAENWKLEYKDNTAQELADTIDRINAHFQDAIRHKRLNKLINKAALFAGYAGQVINPKKCPLEFMMWNRCYDKDLINRPAHYKGYTISFGHGHDSHEQTRENIFNLDVNNRLGRPGVDEDTMNYVRVKHQPRVVAQHAQRVADPYQLFINGIKQGVFSDILQEVKMNNGTASVPGQHLRLELKENNVTANAALQHALEKQGITFEALSHGNPFLVIKAQNNPGLFKTSFTKLVNDYQSAKNQLNARNEAQPVRENAPQRAQEEEMRLHAAQAQRAWEDAQKRVQEEERRLRAQREKQNQDGKINQVKQNITHSERNLLALNEEIKGLRDLVGGMPELRPLLNQRIQDQAELTKQLNTQKELLQNYQRNQAPANASNQAQRGHEEAQKRAQEEMRIRVEQAQRAAREDAQRRAQEQEMRLRAEQAQRDRQEAQKRAQEEEIRLRAQREKQNQDGKLNQVKQNITDSERNLLALNEEIKGLRDLVGGMPELRSLLNQRIQDQAELIKQLNAQRELLQNYQRNQAPVAAPVVQQDGQFARLKLNVDRLNQNLLALNDEVKSLDLLITTQGMREVIPLLNQRKQDQENLIKEINIQKALLLNVQKNQAPATARPVQKPQPAKMNEIKAPPRSQGRLFFS